MNVGCIHRIYRKCFISWLDILCFQLYLIVRPEASLSCVRACSSGPVGWGSGLTEWRRQVEGSAVGSQTQIQFGCRRSLIPPVLHDKVLSEKSKHGLEIVRMRQNVGIHVFRQCYTYCVELSSFSCLMRPLVQRALMCYFALRTSMKVIGHKIDEVQVPENLKKGPINFATQNSLSRRNIFKENKGFILRDLCYFISTINCIFPSSYSSSKHQSGTACGCGLCFISLH